MEEMNKEQAHTFLLKTYYPTVMKFAEELGIDSDECFSGKADVLEEWTIRIESREGFTKQMERLLDEHRKIFAQREHDQKLMEKARRATEAATIEGETWTGGTFAKEADCPACENPAILFCEVDGEYMDGEAVTTGAYVSGLECRFCDIVLNAYDEVDYFDLHKYLYGESG
jgi:hypothetical protein